MPMLSLQGQIPGSLNPLFALSKPIGQKLFRPAKKLQDLAVNILKFGVALFSLVQTPLFFMLGAAAAIVFPEHMRAAINRIIQCGILYQPAPNSYFRASSHSLAQLFWHCRSLRWSLRFFIASRKSRSYPLPEKRQHLLHQAMSLSQVF